MVRGKGTQHLVYPLAPDYTGCGHPDPDHSYTGGRICYANAQAYTACDNWHASILGPAFANRMFLWAAQTYRITDSILFANLPTILDSLGAAEVSHRYYFSNLPYLAFWGGFLRRPDLHGSRRWHGQR